MKVFKFGGASVKDADGVKNLCRLLQQTGHSDVFLVVSAMGKTTNAMEEVVEAYFKEGKDFSESLDPVESFHFSLAQELFEEGDPVFTRLQVLFEEVRGFLKWIRSPKYAFVYDQVVGYGELLSTALVSHYLQSQGLENEWIDVRHYIKTDRNYRDAGVDWDQTQARIRKGIKSGPLYITQGFLGSDENNFTTTLGREGSDYTAAILGYCLDAESVTIWKDVSGVLNADPRYFEETTLLEQVSYREAIELAFYGASVIHPKTLQPLQSKEIPLYVRSFIQPKEKGTEVGRGKKIKPEIPCFIVKKKQVLLQLSTLDFSFMAEHHLSNLFDLLHQYRLKTDLIQNSAISFSVCLDNRFGGLEALLKDLEQQFKVHCYRDVDLYTIRHFTEEAVEKTRKDKDVVLEQRNGETVQLVTR